MFRKGTRQSRVSMERIKAAANSKLMRLAQKMIVRGALLLDRGANFHLHHLAAPPVEQLFSAVVDEVCRFCFSSSSERDAARKNLAKNSQKYTPVVKVART